MLPTSGAGLVLLIDGLSEGLGDATDGGWGDSTTSWDCC